MGLDDDDDDDDDDDAGLEEDVFVGWMMVLEMVLPVL